MLYALSTENVKVRATPNVVATCPLCNEALVPKCGPIKIWHFAHQPLTTCDAWYEPESEWHLGWKSLVKPEYSEVLVRSNGVCHIADIKTPDRVIEFQKSPLSYIDRKRRESFFGPRLIWVVYQDRAAIDIKYKSLSACTFRWKHPKEWLITYQLLFPFFLDIGRDQLLKVIGIKKYPYHKSIIDSEAGVPPSYRTGGWGKVITKDEFISQYLAGYLNE